MKLKLIKKEPENGGAVTFYFEPQEEVEWQPGQYLRYHINEPTPDERGENRFFSIASAPFENHIHLTTKFAENESSSFKKDLQKLEAGDTVEAFGPSGYFTAENPNQEFVFIAGGIGITPFRAILLDLDHQQKPLNVKLIYGNRTKDVVFKEELEALAAKHPEFKIYYVISDEPTEETQATDNTRLIPGKINESLIKSVISNLQSSIYYISGPESMVMTLERFIWDMGIPKENTKRDYFPGYEHY